MMTFLLRLYFETVDELGFVYKSCRRCMYLCQDLSFVLWESSTVILNKAL
jgi:hypothetical protein